MKQQMLLAILVFIGGGTGAVCRYTIGWMLAPWAFRFPFATFLSNILACLVLGVLTGYQMQGALPERHRLLLATGFCGGFSTFSTFTAETWQQWQSGQPVLFGLNIFFNFTFCWIFFLLGLKIAQAAVRY